MRYDLEELSWRVAQRRERFTRAVVLQTLLLAAAIAVLIFYPETTVTFICAVSAILLACGIIVTVKRYEVLILFGKGFCGTNVKEHEYVLGARARNSRWFGRYTLGSGRISKSNIHSIVYLRLDDGSVIAVDGHMKAHTDVYEIGDRLTRHEGTRYLTVDSDGAKRSPCPLCGTVNDGTRLGCEGCGLGIIKGD